MTFRTKFKNLQCTVLKKILLVWWILSVCQETQSTYGSPPIRLLAPTKITMVPQKIQRLDNSIQIRPHAQNHSSCTVHTRIARRIIYPSSGSAIKVKWLIWPACREAGQHCKHVRPEPSRDVNDFLIFFSSKFILQFHIEILF